MNQSKAQAVNLLRHHQGQGQCQLLDLLDWMLKKRQPGKQAPKLPKREKSSAQSTRML
jgi:hypothetical protein